MSVGLYRGFYAVLRGGVVRWFSVRADIETRPEKPCIIKGVPVNMQINEMVEYQVVYRLDGRTMEN